jgi:ATP-binding cassette, subfamily B, bacterial MsbA
MRVFFRILEYSNNLISKLIQFFVFSVLGTVFGLITFAVTMPLLETLFDKANVTKISPLPHFELTTEYAIGTFNHFYSKTVMQYGKLDALLFICVCIIASTLLSSVFKYLERIVASQMRVNVVKNLRTEIFSKVTRLQISYFNTHRKGDLISRFTGDVQEIESTVINSLKTVLKEPVTILIYFAAMFFISVKLTLFALIVLPIVGGVLGGIVKRLKKKATLSQESLGRIVNLLDETFSGMRVIKAFNARQYSLDKMSKENNHYSKVNLSMAYKNELASPVSELLGVLIVTIIMYFGGSLILSGESELTAKSFIGFLIFFSQIIQPAKSFSSGITSLQKGIASARRIFTVIDTQPSIENKPNAIVLNTFEKNIEFKNVSFAYDTDLVLRNVNLTVEKGKTIALVGTSGGGKSTLADLVPRFYDPTDGEVCIDDISLRDYEIESLRKQMGVVTQESILFNDTIFNNIAFGLPNVNEEAVIEAAKIANAHNFIMQTENGYQTNIGERGSKLSGGQRQRLSIARAVLKNPPILILDEATSALDSESEKLVQEALFNLMKNRTSIVIAHRLSTIQHADEIIVIQHGQIIERGTHDSLIKKNGLYKKLNEIQRSTGS